MTNSEYSAWLVDLDGTLYHARGLKIVMAVDLLVHPASIRLVRTFRKQHERLRSEGFGDGSQCGTASPFDEQIARTAQVTGLSPDFVRAAAWSWMVERPCRWLRRFRRDDLVDAIVEFRRNGGKTALVSDYPALEKLRALEVDKLFDQVIANGEAGEPCALKPSPMGFLTAASRLGVEPSLCLVIGDRDDADGEAARRAGMGFRLV